MKPPPLFNILSVLVEDVLEFQRNNDSILGILGPKAFLKEFCTVKLATRRRAGHTTAIRKCLGYFPNSIVLVPNAAMRQIYLDGSPAARGRVFVVRGASDVQKLVDVKAGPIFVDCAYFMSEKTREALYDLAGVGWPVWGICIAFVE